MFHIPFSRVPYRPRAHLSVDAIQDTHEPTRPLAVLIRKETKLALAGGDQGRQHHARFVVAIPVAIDALDATERILALYVILNRVLVLFGSPETLSGTHL